MIVRPRPHWFAMLFVLRGSVVPVIAPRLFWTTAFALIVTLLHGEIGRWKVPLNFVPFSLIGLTLAIFLGFRNGTSYARWWEARTLWGSVLSESRSLLRQALTLPGDAGRNAAGEAPAAASASMPAAASVPMPAAVAVAVPGTVTTSAPAAADTATSTPASTHPHDSQRRAEARLLAMRLIAFVHAMRHQLRGSDPSTDMARLLPAVDCGRVATAQIEEPFGLEPNDLALEEMSTLIEHSLREMAGDVAEPSPVRQPEDYIRI